MSVSAKQESKRATYPAYKPSEMDWVGDIPSHWEIHRLKRVASLEYGGSLAAEDRLEGPCPVYGSNGVVGNHNLANTNSPCLIIGRKGSFGKVAYSDHPCYAIDTTYFIDCRNSSSDLRWLYYCLQWLRLDAVSKDSAVPGLSREDAYTQVMPYCPLPEQRAIAAFLDRETARIDGLIEKKQRQIELLQEKRAALISHAVTKGLDPTANMKPSGIEWLGEVPAHWTVGNIRRFARMKTGHTPRRTHAEYWQDCTIAWFTLADVWQLRDGRQKYLGETKEKISALGLANSAAELLPAGTVVFSRTASIGFSGIIPTPMATSQDFWNWICLPALLPDYLLCLFRAMRQEFMALMMGSTHKTIYQPIAAGISVCVPPIEEQTEIVSHIESKAHQIDLLTTKVEESIEMLREYRTALISAAVTGKIDVRREIS